MAVLNQILKMPEDAFQIKPEFMVIESCLYFEFFNIIITIIINNKKNYI